MIIALKKDIRKEEREQLISWLEATESRRIFPKGSSRP